MPMAKNVTTTRSDNERDRVRPNWGSPEVGTADKACGFIFNKNLKNTALPVVLTELPDFWTSPIFLNLPLFELFDGYRIVDVTSPFLEPTEPFLGAMETIVLIGAGISQ